MARLFHRWPTVPTRTHSDVPDDGGSAAPAGQHAPAATTGRAHSVRPRLRHRSQRLLANRAVRDAVVSLAGVVGRPVRNQGGAEIGRLVDVVCRWTGDETYPPVTGLVVRVGRRLAFVDASAIETIEHTQVRLKTARLDLTDFTPRPGEVTLADQVLDHQLVDVDGVQVIRAADLYLAPAVRPVLPGRRRHLGAEPVATPGPGPVAAHADPGPGHRLGRHPALRRDRAGRGPRGPSAHDQRGPRAPPPRRARRPARGPDAARTTEAPRLADPGGGGRRPRGDGSRGAGIAAP